MLKQVYKLLQVIVRYLKAVRDEELESIEAYYQQWA